MAENSKWTSYQTIIAILMVVTGSINTLAAKWADKLEAPAGVPFNHPFLQAVCMFIGEFLCLPVFFLTFWFQKNKYKKSAAASDIIGEASAVPTIPRFNPLVFLPAAVCDMTATSIMYVGLNLTNAASFQMLRGAVIIFTGLLSVAFLRSVLRAYQWLGMLGVMMGLAIVGVSDILFNGADLGDRNGVISGDLLIIMAQIVASVQMVYEQKFVTKYNVPPLLAVGLEGLYGMIMLSILLVPMYYIHVPHTFSTSPEGRLEDAFDAFSQMGQNPLIILALVGTIVSIAFFNFAGITVTKELSATTRMVLDSVRTLIIWGFSLAVSWQKFAGFQVLGFAVLLVGMATYNDLIFAPFIRSRIDPWLAERGLTCCRWCYVVPPPHADHENGAVRDRPGSKNEHIDDGDTLVENEITPANA